MISIKLFVALTINICQYLEVSLSDTDIICTPLRSDILEEGPIDRLWKIIGLVSRL